MTDDDDDARRRLGTAIGLAAVLVAAIFIIIYWLEWTS